MPRAPQHRRLKSSEERTYSRAVVSDPRYHTPLWLAVADQVRERDASECQQCKREGGMADVVDSLMRRKMKQCRKCRGKGCGDCSGSGTDVWKPPVDHIKPAYVCSDEEFYDLDNLEVSCSVHNRRKIEADAKKWGPKR